jgi:NAD(P)-dependent dehydrogenase (short-subunit alcohol dehydrogenase family)
VTTIANPRRVGALRPDGKRLPAAAGRDRDELSAAKSALADEFGAQVRTAAVDLAEPRPPTELAQRAAGAFGGLDVLVDTRESKAAPMIARIPLRRFAVPRDVSDTVLRLASDAASMICGVDVRVDGGYSMG